MIALELDFSAVGPPARVAVDVPSGFQLYPDRPEGSLIGNVEIYAVSGGYGAATLSLFAGEIDAAPLDAAAEAAVQSCSPGKHVAIWTAELSCSESRSTSPSTCCLRARTIQKGPV